MAGCKLAEAVLGEELMAGKAKVAENAVLAVPD
jgi:hypothetical protein